MVVAETTPENASYHLDLFKSVGSFELGCRWIRRDLNSNPLSRIEREMIRFFLMMNKQGTTRISQFYDINLESLERRRLERDVFESMVSVKGRNVCQVQGYNVVFHRYVGLYVVIGCDKGDNELLAHEAIHLFVEILDKFFGTVREIDIIYHFNSVYAILNEFILGGFLQETNIDTILQRLKQMPQLCPK